MHEGSHDREWLQLICRPLRFHYNSVQWLPSLTSRRTAAERWGCASGAWGRLEGWKIAAEVGLVFLVFFIQGAVPVPEVNEPYYLGKAIHFWNPHWAANDFFLNTADCHKVFYVTFGWLALWLAPPALAWVGRLLTWGTAGLGLAAAELRRGAAGLVGGAHRRAAGWSDEVVSHGRGMDHRRRGGQGVRLRPGFSRPGGHPAEPMARDVAALGRGVGVSRPGRRLVGLGGGRRLAACRPASACRCGRSGRGSWADWALAMLGDHSGTQAELGDRPATGAGGRQDLCL